MNKLEEYLTAVEQAATDCTCYECDILCGSCSGARHIPQLVKLVRVFSDSLLFVYTAPTYRGAERRFEESIDRINKLIQELDIPNRDPE